MSVYSDLLPTLLHKKLGPATMSKANNSSPNFSNSSEGFITNLVHLNSISFDYLHQAVGDSSDSATVREVAEFGEVHQNFVVFARDAVGIDKRLAHDEPLRKSFVLNLTILAWHLHQGNMLLVAACASADASW